MFDIEENLKKLPNTPGVYLMKDQYDNIIYIGKAISLKKRVRQYFNKQDKISRISSMISNIRSFEYIITDTEDEALILESNLIKIHKPKYNVLLKDDKSYPYIKLDIKSDFPTIMLTRRKLDDGSKYYGPYPSTTAAKQLIDIIKDKYMLRLCNPFKLRKRPCIYYQIKKCDAPCIGNVTKEEYSKRIAEIMLILQGNTKDIIKELKEDMKVLANKKKYEEAAELRDKILNIERISQRQKISNFSYNEIDAIGIYRDEIEVCIEVFYVRESKLQERKQVFLKDIKELTNEDIITAFLKQRYLNNENIPSKIMIKYDIEDKEILEKIFSKQVGRKVEILSTKIGQNLRFVELAEKNAKISLDNRNRNSLNILNELKEKLNLERLPKRIEMYDVSNLSGTNTTSAMVVADGAKLKRNLSRRFNLEKINIVDDVLATKETIKRRIEHNLRGGQGLGELPDLIIADGGINQINAIIDEIDRIKKEMLDDELSLDIAVYGLIKDEKHKTKALIDKDRNEIEVGDKVKLFLTNLQEEVHKLAINYHIKKRDSNIQKSVLDDIIGIGEVRKQRLFKEFKTIDNMIKASIEELTKVKGITEDLAIQIKGLEIE